MSLTKIFTAINKGQYNILPELIESSNKPFHYIFNKLKKRGDIEIYRILSDKINNRDLINAFAYSQDRAFRKDILSLIENRDLSQDYFLSFSANENILLKNATLLREYLSMTIKYYKEHRINIEGLSKEIFDVLIDFEFIFDFDQLKILNIAVLEFLLNKKTFDIKNRISVNLGCHCGYCECNDDNHKNRDKGIIGFSALMHKDDEKIKWCLEKGAIITLDDVIYNPYLRKYWDQ